ncbi:hypothetical protein AB4090_07810 [Acidithiobacillus sp. IBUN Pt1247-S3]|uniref:hypothetical protein n=1 Tax=Acidithiobacillus sp. IBUN Pt1247-S3 TaxID=3166642 RepID=UPI0034E4BF7A
MSYKLTPRDRAMYLWGMLGSFLLLYAWLFFLVYMAGRSKLPLITSGPVHLLLGIFSPDTHLTLTVMGGAGLVTFVFFTFFVIFFLTPPLFGPRFKTKDGQEYREAVPFSIFRHPRWRTLAVGARACYVLTMVVLVSAGWDLLLGIYGSAPAGFPVNLFTAFGYAWTHQSVVMEEMGRQGAASYLLGFFTWTVLFQMGRLILFQMGIWKPRHWWKLVGDEGPLIRDRTPEEEEQDEAWARVNSPPIVIC